MDTEALDRMALWLEAKAHRGGWDGDPAMFIVYDHTDADTEAAYAARMGPRVTLGPYAARLMVPTEILLPQPAHSLFRLALNLTHAPDSPWVVQYLDVLRRPGFIGIGLAFEGWRWDGSPEERAAFGDRRLADTPGAVENRMVTLADRDGALHVALRIRGKKPELAEGWSGCGGAVPESLLVIAAVIAGKPAPDLTCTPTGWKD